MTAYVEVKSQQSRGSIVGRHGGPDTYFAVQCVPDGVERLLSLNRRAAARRGIVIIFCGEGYSDRQATSRSMYNQAKSEATRIALEINAGADPKNY